jgi:amino acid transporter
LLLAYLTISNGSGFISWICCSIIYFCFNMACKVRGIKKLYTSKIQLYRMLVSLVGALMLALFNGLPCFSYWNGP